MVVFCGLFLIILVEGQFITSLTAFYANILRFFNNLGYNPLEKNDLYKATLYYE